MKKLVSFKQLQSGQKIARVCDGSMLRLEILQYVCPHPNNWCNKKHIFINVYDGLCEAPVALKEGDEYYNWYIFESTDEAYKELKQMLINRLESTL